VRSLAWQVGGVASLVKRKDRVCGAAYRGPLAVANLVQAVARMSSREAGRKQLLALLACEVANCRVAMMRGRRLGLYVQS